MNTIDLINLLEQEMSDSVISQTEKIDNKIKIEDVKDWYFEAEKLLRVVSNLTLYQTDHQILNQLRYAGHHILKFETTIDEEEKHANIVKAYKHCKRAYYDVLDGYVLSLSDAFKNKILYIKDPIQREKFQKKINDNIISLIKKRSKKDNSRHKFYKFIVETLIQGLKDLEIIYNLVDIPQQNKQALIDKNTALLNREVELKETIKKLKKDDNIATRSGFVITMAIAAATLLGLLFQGSLTNRFVKSPSQHSIEITTKKEKSALLPINTSVILKSTKTLK